MPMYSFVFPVTFSDIIIGTNTARISAVSNAFLVFLPPGRIVPPQQIGRDCININPVILIHYSSPSYLSRFLQIKQAAGTAQD